MLLGINHPFFLNEYPPGARFTDSISATIARDASFYFSLNFLLLLLHRKWVASGALAQRESPPVFPPLALSFSSSTSNLPLHVAPCALRPPHFSRIRSNTASLRAEGRAHLAGCRLQDWYLAGVGYNKWCPLRNAGPVSLSTAFRSSQTVPCGGYLNALQQQQM